MMWRASKTSQGKGERDPKRDKGCTRKISSDEAGYCDCKNGHYYYDKGHEPFTCLKACEGPRPHQKDETRDLVSEWRTMKIKNKEKSLETTARDQETQKILVVVLLVLGAYILFFTGRKPRKSDKEEYIERMKEFKVIQ